MNKAKPSEDLLARYQKTGAELVRTVLVAALLTVCVAVADVLVMKFGSALR